jgi:mRNA-degrading endonuclease RelE of RelBE toxin-antitoxin system
VHKDLENVPAHITKRFLRALDEFEKDPIRPRPGFDVKPLKGFTHTYRHRIGDYRVLFVVQVPPGIVKITSIDHRSRAY